jgi:hypothetical protein
MTANRASKPTLSLTRETLLFLSSEQAIGVQGGSSGAETSCAGPTCTWETVTNTGGGTVTNTGAGKNRI